MHTGTITVDGNEAVASVAYRTNEVIAIYPITPASPMGELADLWAARGRRNVWGTVPRVVEMQAEGGAAGTVHGALQAGALTTTFTASQGLLLMIPNMYKIAGELTPAVFHIAARSVAAQALSIFGDHSDVMAARATGWGMLFAANPQEAADFALIAQKATLESRIPYLNIMDGFRTSHQISKIQPIADETIRSMIGDASVAAHRARALTPDRPVVRGTAQNPDVFFQARESVNPFYLAATDHVEDAMGQLADLTGRRYQPFDYVGHPEAERVVVLMGSGADAAHETIEALVDAGEAVGAIKVRLYRPFAADRLLAALPSSVRAIAVLDRTKEPGSAGEPLYQDVVTAISEGMAAGQAPFERMPQIVGGRYGLSSKEFTPGMIKGVLDNLALDRPRNHFVVGIVDDVTGTSLDYDADFSVESPLVRKGIFWGLGSDGTVGANKNSIKIIGEHTDLHAQGYFVYDSRKAGARTISHLRFGPEPIRSTYLIRDADFVGVHQIGFLGRYDTLEHAADGATVLLNSPYKPDALWDQLPARFQRQLVEKNLRLFAIDAYGVARANKLGPRINTIMQTCFFGLVEVLPREEAIGAIKQAIEKTYGKRGPTIVETNHRAVDAALENLHEVQIPAEPDLTAGGDGAVVDPSAPDFVQTVTAAMLAGKGDALPVSALPVDGTYPVGTTKWEKRNLALELPVWETDLCIQCGKCVMACPHSVIRAKVVDDKALTDSPEGFKSMDASWRSFDGRQYTIQVAVEDCTGCRLCVEVCPAKDRSNVSRKALNMRPAPMHREQGIRDWDFFQTLAPTTRTNGDGLAFTKQKDVQLLDPLFEFSGACAGCGETPYLSLLTRLFGDRMLVANATGCSSIYGGNLPTTPWTANAEGRGPAWSNSLFEDNAEFGLGMHLAVDQHRKRALALLEQLQDELGGETVAALRDADQTAEPDVAAQRERVADLRAQLERIGTPEAAELSAVANYLCRKTVWIVGGDGWAYDIGYGGLDHVLASGQNVNVLVLDTEVYSNTGGQASKATGLGAVAKFAAGGKPTPKKDLGKLAIDYGYVYVAQVAMGANENQTIKAIEEAESYEGPSLVIAYSHCIAHGIDMARGVEQQGLAERSGYWPLYRFDPRRTEAGENPMQLDSKPPNRRFKEYAYNENRYRVLTQFDPEAADRYLKEAQTVVDRRWRQYADMAAPRGGDGLPTSETAKPRRPGKLPPARPTASRPSDASVSVAPPAAGKLRKPGRDVEDD